MTETARLTDTDRRVCASARQIADTLGPAAVREYTGMQDVSLAYASAFAEAQERINYLLALVDRLGGHG